MAAREVPRRPVIGWREWIALPALGIERIKAKIDTGARSSALHAFGLERLREDGRELVEFKVHPNQRNDRDEVEVVAELIDERVVTNSGGVRELRPVVLLDVALMGEVWTIETTLTRRDEMGFRMLIGRQAVKRRFCIDPGRSFVGGRQPAAFLRTDES